MHLISLRRHDPDQVRWVGPEFGLSARKKSRAPHEIAKRYLNLAAQGRKAALPAAPLFAGLPAHDREKLVLDLIGDGAGSRTGSCASKLPEARMTPFFVQIKCELGKAYQVANALAEAEIASEIYSTAGNYDLLVKFYVDADTDIGHFVNEKVQSIPGIKDTYTIITFKAFQA
jgi:DNA-binding Lrp family transcriptional regulator